MTGPQNLKIGLVTWYSLPAYKIWRL